MPHPPKLGRPPKSAADKCSAKLYLKLTPSERAELDDAAADKGERISEWAKRLLLRAARTT